MDQRLGDHVGGPQRLEQLLQSISSSSGVPIGVEAAEHPLQQLKRGDGSGVYGIADQLQQLEWRRIQQPGDGYLLLLARDLAPQEQALQQQRQFVNQLAHELNTPLAIVNGSLRQLGKKLLEFGDGSMERLRQAQQETSRLVRLLRHLLVLTDLETGRRQLQLQPLDAEALAAGMDGPARSAWGSAEWNLVSNRGEDAAIAIDAEALAEVLGAIARQQPALQRWACSDQAATAGAGWSHWFALARPRSWHHAEPRSQVFERFVRLEEHRNFNQADGAGLGLALCEALMQAMGGSIELQPNAQPSTGCVFLLRWPQVLRQVAL